MGEKLKDLTEKVRETIKLHNMIDTSNPIVVGVSGGPDSMALMDMLLGMTKSKIIAAHLNHKFRGKEAEEDAAFVREQCIKKGITYEIQEYNVPEYMAKTGMGAQEAAREVRYNFYYEVAEKYHADKIALGHHASDQAETVIMRLIRGTGPQGLAGIPYVRAVNECRCKIIRPLLDITRKEIEQYCEERSILYIIDKSNLSTKYFRNKIRLELLPQLEKYNPKLVSHISQLSMILHEENDYLDHEAKNFLDKYNILDSIEKIEINVLIFRNLHIALQRRVIHLILSYLHLSKEISFIHIEEIIGLVNHDHPSKSLDMPMIRVYRNYDQLIFSKKDNNKIVHYKYNLIIPGDLVLESGIRVRTYLRSTFEKPSGNWAVFDYDQMETHELTIRTKQDGDRIEILGMKGSKKIKDIFIDEKIPKKKRETYPIVEYEKKVVWIPGLRRSNHALISENTKNFLYIVAENI